MGQAITLVLLRKRVFTKSPVRENRTPGSVRGLSGNWQSYRNQLVTYANDKNAEFLPTIARSVLRLISADSALPQCAVLTLKLNL